MPQLVTGLTGLGAGDHVTHHSLALTADGELYVWGKGPGASSGWRLADLQGGDGCADPDAGAQPVAVDKSDSDDTVNGIVPNGVAAGYYPPPHHERDGRPLHLGRGNGRLCNGETTAVSQPTSTSISGVLRVYPGGARIQGGSPRTDGVRLNLRGQLGSGSSAATRARRWRCGTDAQEV